jgi:uncharacterized protein involved in exopolysaccharide biosynthesis
MLGHASLMRPIDRSRRAVRELSRYAAARTFAAAVTAATFAGGVIAPPSFSANALLALSRGVSRNLPVKGQPLLHS